VMKRVAVTGGNGGLGQGVVQRLVQQGYAVRNIDRVASKAQFDGDIETLLLDLTDYDAVHGAFEGCDAVIHLAAFPTPNLDRWPTIYANNTVSSYNVLFACAEHGIKKVCMASSINATGAAYSRTPRFDYFPLDEKHPTYNEDPYSLSKWVLELQADSIARRYEGMTISSLRFHGIFHDMEQIRAYARNAQPVRLARNLWGCVSQEASARACQLAIEADFIGHEVFYIVAPTTCVDTPSLELAKQYHPDVPVRGDLSGCKSFFDTSKAQRVLGWMHDLVESE
jgi:nucleoside-diphosphate-sugar epimerase